MPRKKSESPAAPKEKKANAPKKDANPEKPQREEPPKPKVWSIAPTLNRAEAQIVTKSLGRYIDELEREAKRLGVEGLQLDDAHAKVRDRIERVIQLKGKFAEQVELPLTPIEQEAAKSFAAPPLGATTADTAAPAPEQKKPALDGMELTDPEPPKLPEGFVPPRMPKAKKKST